MANIINLTNRTLKFNYFYVQSNNVEKFNQLSDFFDYNEDIKYKSLLENKKLLFSGLNNSDMDFILSFKKFNIILNLVDYRDYIIEQGKVILHIIEPNRTKLIKAILDILDKYSLTSLLDYNLMLKTKLLYYIIGGDMSRLLNIIMNDFLINPLNNEFEKLFEKENVNLDKAQAIKDAISDLTNIYINYKSN